FVEAQDCFLDAPGVGAIHEPEAAAESLIESASGISANAPRNHLTFAGADPIEIALMKSKSVHGETLHQRSEAASRGVRAETKPRQPRISPARADVKHVGVPATGTGQKLCESAWPPWGEVIQKR